MFKLHCVNVVYAQFDIGSLFSHSLLESVNLSSMKEGAGSVTSQTVAETSRVQKINLIRFAYLHILEVFMREEGRSFLGFYCGNYKHVRGLCVYREL